jgi:hypothetical protein
VRPAAVEQGVGLRGGPHGQGSPGAEPEFAGCQDFSDLPATGEPVGGRYGGERNGRSRTG